MKIKQVLCTGLACLMLLSCCMTGVSAVALSSESIAPYAAVQINFTVNAGSNALASSSFPMEKGEKVKISATYSPKSATIDCGIVDEDGNFQYLTSSNGSISGSITIKENGSYRLAVRNISTVAITISGTVNY